MEGQKILNQYHILITDQEQSSFERLTLVALLCSYTQKVEKDYILKLNSLTYNLGLKIFQENRLVSFEII